MYPLNIDELIAFKRLAHSTSTLIALANSAAETLPTDRPVPEELWNLLAHAKEVGVYAVDACQAFFDMETAISLSSQLEDLDQRVEARGYSF